MRTQDPMMLNHGTDHLSNDLQSGLSVAGLGSGR